MAPDQPDAPDPGEDQAADHDASPDAASDRAPRVQMPAAWARMPTWAQRLVAALATLGVTLFVAAIGVPLIAGPFVGLVASAVEVEVTPEQIDDLPGLAERSIVVDADGETLATLHDEIDRRVVALDGIPAHVQQAVLAAEDRRFHEHDGYDERAILRAMFANLRAGEVEQGASTITQQVAQQSFLGREQTVARKTEELAYAVALEDHLTKDEILERYLNEVYFGSGAYGIAAAAEQFFRVEPDELTVDQAALLAGLIRAPEALNPRQEAELAQTRRNQVLAGMADEGFIDEAEAERLAREPVAVEPRLERDVEEPYAVEAVKREFSTLEAFGDDPEERFQELFAGGLVIHTTLDRRLQEIAETVVDEGLPDDAGPTAALISIDPRSEAIRALHGGVDFDETQFDLATQGRRQPGSALKPFIAEAALSRGLSPEAVFEGDGPLAFLLDDESEPWEVDNFAASRHGTIDLAQATSSSVNTAFAQLVLMVGVDEAIEAMGTLGIDAEAAFGDPETWGPSIVLGGLTHGVTPLEMAVAYGTFADQGRRGPPYLIERVENAAGEVVYEREPDERRQVVEPGVNATMLDLLQGVVEFGTGTAAQLEGWDVIGKTGTTDDRSDAWFVGATATLSTAVWVGHPEEQVPMPEMTGGSLPAQLWHAYMVQALEGAEPQPFPDQDAARDLPSPGSVSVPDLTGMPVGAALVEAAEAGLTVVLADGDGADPTRTVVMQDPAPGTSLATGEPVALRFSRPAPPEPPEDEEDADDEDEDEDQADEDDEDDEDDDPPELPDPPGDDEDDV